TKILVGQAVPETMEYKVKTKDGREIWILSNMRVNREAGRPVTVTVVAHDITERKRLEEQLLWSQKMESVGRLAGGIAHDFNNLLTTIRGYIELGLMDLHPSNGLYKDLKEVLRAANRAAELTRQLLAFSRRQETEPHVINLNDVLLDMDKMLRRLIGEDIELVTRPSEKLGSVRVDPGQMEQVLVNLAVNARDAMPKGGKLTI
ncbi:MAG: PAS domain S-box protein, partial [candidate division Zixibacteria bacterium]|nr:PAS domain S-box protein [candidate division Zixibacteria bacterium]